MQTNRIIRQAAITPSDTVAITYDGIRINAAGNIALKFKNDTAAITWTVTAGEYIYGNIVAVMATNTNIAAANIIGLELQ